jgi:hypothetical protein
LSEWDDIFGGKPVKDTPKDVPSETPKAKKETTEAPATTPKQQQITLEETVTIPKVEAGETVEVEVSKKSDAAKEFFKDDSKKPEKVVNKSKSEFDFSQAKSQSGETYTIYGHKGHGKTFLAYSFPGDISVLSFDRKGVPVKDLAYGGTDRIKVFDAVRYHDMSSPEAWLESSDRTFRYINSLLDHIKENENPDWIVLDGLEIYNQIAEMTMRYRNNLLPYQGVANMNLWKERRLYIRQLHYKALAIARRGIIYTTYVDKEKIIVDGDVQTLSDIPKWIDVVLQETDTVLKIERKDDKNGVKYWVKVESSKTRIPTSHIVDCTGKGILDVFPDLKGKKQ